MINYTNEEISIKELHEAISNFVCCKDPAIHDFLKEKSIRFVERKRCNVYLILDKNSLSSGKIKIEAYFALLHKAIRFGDSVSNTTKKNITGYKDRELMSFVLIGQLGKYISDDENEIYVSEIDINEIVSYIDEIVASANEFIPCKFVLVECLDEIHKKGIYSKAGFKYLQRDGEYHQYYKALN